MERIKDLKDAHGLWKRSIFVGGKRVCMRGGQIWNSLVQRCKTGSKTKTDLPTYKDAENHFLDFQDFMEWATNQIGYSEGYDLDKDILIKGNKVYSRETCVFVPHEINMFFTKRQQKRENIPIGVIKRKDCKRYTAQGHVNGVTKNLGTFRTAEEAFNAYKSHKESRALELAEKWKDKIDPRVYNVLCNYSIEITD